MICPDCGVEFTRTEFDEMLVFLRHIIDEHVKPGNPDLKNQMIGFFIAAAVDIYASLGGSSEGFAALIKNCLKSPLTPFKKTGGVN
jgi:hypothetical protein